MRDNRHSLKAYLLIFGPPVLGLARIEDRWPTMFVPALVVFGIMAAIACFVYLRVDVDDVVDVDSTPRRRVIVRPATQRHDGRRPRRRIREQGRPSVRIAQVVAWVSGVGSVCLYCAFVQVGWLTYSGEVLLGTLAVFVTDCVVLWWLTYGPGSWESNRKPAQGEVLVRMGGDTVRSSASPSRRSDLSH